MIDMVKSLAERSTDVFAVAVARLPLTQNPQWRSQRTLKTNTVLTASKRREHKSKKAKTNKNSTHTHTHKHTHTHTHTPVSYTHLTLPTTVPV